MFKYKKGTILKKKIYENVYELFLILKDVYEDDEYIYGVKLSDKNNDYYELLKIDNDLDFSDVSISGLYHEIKCDLIIEKIRKEVPDVTLRTSLIVGFPGETKENFEELLEFVKNTKFDKLGTFMYSKEEGTPAAKLPDQIHGNTKKARYNKIMEAQQEISKEILTDKIGKNYKVLVEDMSFDGKYFIGRTMQDVPEEDGLVYIKNNKDLDDNTILNNFVNCKIIEVSNYDLIGEIQK